MQRLVDSRQLVLLFNAQWQGGQVVSDFGLLPWVRRKREELVRLRPFTLVQPLLHASMTARVPACSLPACFTDYTCSASIVSCPYCLSCCQVEPAQCDACSWPMVACKC